MSPLRRLPLSTNPNPICCSVAPKSPPTTTTSKPTSLMHFAVRAQVAARRSRGRLHDGRTDRPRTDLEFDLNQQSGRECEWHRRIAHVKSQQQQHEVQKRWTKLRTKALPTCRHCTPATTTLHALSEGGMKGGQRFGAPDSEFLLNNCRTIEEEYAEGGGRRGQGSAFSRYLIGKTA